MTLTQKKAPANIQLSELDGILFTRAVAASLTKRERERKKNCVWKQKRRKFPSLAREFPTAGT